MVNLHKTWQNVVVALLVNSTNEVLITQRGLKKTYATMWEFPGGKVEQNEKFHQALKRELKEELGLGVKIANYIGPYIGNNNILHVYQVTNWQGEASCCEDQLDLAWVKVKDLKKAQFPMTNHILIDSLIHNRRPAACPRDLV
ncbi:MAG: hypothetical protein A3F18_04425 [Legionellales bacterium RIFCSPHIGHO2_12_FULL_37_14]|nr:MAG: hypothetical protein A3F18_04425 [Legionellales bacterium RIFCSPHIGHO2_12_FULL_37_14]